MSKAKINSDETILDQEAKLYPASSLEKHHRVKLQYPCFDLKEKRNRGIIFPPSNIHQRHEPKPLIKTPSAEAHSSYGSRSEWQFFSYTPAPFEVQPADENNLNFPPLETLSEHQRLRRDMDWATSRAGKTTLRMFTYQSTGHGSKPQPAKLRVERHTHFYVSGSKTDEKHMVCFRARYYFPLTEFNTPFLQPAWVYDTLELLLRRSDRAVKHTADRLAMQNIRVNDVGWLPDRELPLEQALVRYTKTSSLVTTSDDESPACTICGDDLVDAEDGSVTLLCDHSFCASCILPWCHERGPDAANCPLCRAKIFTQQAHIYQILNGLDDDRVYINDPRYTPYENFERSCADLDSRLAENVEMTILTDNPDLLTACFHRLILGAGLETIASTHSALQPRTFPEAIPAMRGIRAGLKILARKPERKMRAAYETLVNMVWKAWTQEMRNGGLEGFLREQSRVEYRGKVVRKFLRPGLEEWVKRLVSRALMMSVLRACLKKEHYEGDTWHRHGGRDFYVPC